MNRADYDALLKLSAAPPVLALSLIEDRTTDRTLLYGYTCTRHTVHTYLKAGVVHSVVYAHDGYLLRHTMFDSVIADPAALLPDKRLYPESCDVQFCRLLRQMGLHLPFTTFTEGQHEARLARNGTCFAGTTLEALTQAVAA